jgi:hypothetical protein
MKNRWVGKHQFKVIAETKKGPRNLHFQANNSQEAIEKALHLCKEFLGDWFHAKVTRV